ncbi:hypothetical protein B0H63DRAFT_476863 [Podospora didyma]|uniref:Uncharacterized protein n=1 Tax=Podospora didyma TaxID=330526 RepID=A0AAE0TWF7_9PEZI|nr:hypothetical protein B0H63DRAFT_476863 [Podospora didyma]
MMDHEMPEAHRKRHREDEYADVSSGGCLGFTEHRSKRFQTLPLRTSPISKRWAEPPNFPPSIPSFAAPAPPRTITPSNSDSDEISVLAQHTWADEPELVSHRRPSASLMVSEMVDSDMDMMDTSDSMPGPAHGHHQNGQGYDQGQQHLQPGQFHPDHAVSSIAGRMPTPIHCSFAAQVRGNNWSGAAGSALQGEPLTITPEESTSMEFRDSSLAEALQGSNMMGHESVPRSFDGSAGTAQVMADWGMVQNRRLPSPISESGGEDSLESPRMVLDSSSQQHHMGHLDHLTHHQHLMQSGGGIPPRASSAVELGAQDRTPSPRAWRESTPLAESPNNNNAMEVESPSTPSPKKGHTRSRHTLASWTALEPGMKRTLSIGYRADCEKCRLKVPGHFNHIIVS